MLDQDAGAVLVFVWRQYLRKNVHFLFVCLSIYMKVNDCDIVSSKIYDGMYQTVVLTIR